MTTALRYILLACGWLSFGLGVVGVFVPVLLTTPLMLLAAACFVKSSEWASTTALVHVDQRRARILHLLTTTSWAA